MTVQFLSAAEQDLQEILEYIAADDPAEALQVLDHIEGEITRLTSYPFMGRPSEYTPLYGRAFRQLTVLRWQVFYKVEPESIVIFRILSSHSDHGHIFLP